MYQYYLSLGSNLGSRINYIHNAFTKLNLKGKISNSSFLYQTNPMYNINQNLFLNSVVQYESDLEPQQALRYFKQIEQENGRTIGKTITENEPRSIDIDILFCNDQIINQQELQIPHQKIQERDFVLKPLMDINPNFIHRTYSKTIKQLYDELITNINLDKSYPQKVLSFHKEKQDKIFNIKEKCLSMGVVNMSPDSFYQSIYDNIAINLNQVQNIEQIMQIIEEKYQEFDILDIGGESTRPNADEIPYNIEIDRVFNVIQQLRRRQPNKIVSLDTRKFEVAKKCSEYIDIINDISGGSYSDQLINLVAETKKPYVLMHSRGTPQTMKSLSNYDNLIEEIINELQQKIDQCIKNMIPRWNIIIDPGLGFAKTSSQNYDIIKSLDKFKELGFPLMIGFSNKRMVKIQFGDENKMIGNASLATICVEKGADIIRIHDQQIIKSIKLANIIYRE